MQISKMKLNDLVNLNPEDMAHLTKRQYITLESRLRKAAERRLEVIDRHGATSYAAEKYFGGELPKPPTSRSSRQAIQHIAVSLQEFLKAKSSSYSGIKKIWREEEKRIFGRRGGFKTEEARTRFWSTYMEFQTQNPALMYGQGASTRLQQFLGKETFWREKNFSADDINKLAEKMLNTGGVDIRARAGREFDI